MVGFLDVLCWGNLLAVTDPTVRAARTSLTHSDRLATVVSKWLDPPRTSQGGSKAGGARDTLLPLMIRTVEQIINNETSSAGLRLGTVVTCSSRGRYYIIEVKFQDVSPSSQEHKTQKLK